MLNDKPIKNTGQAMSNGGIAVNHCTIATANTDNPTWSLAWRQECEARWRADYPARATEIAALDSLEARRKALEKFAEPNRSRIKAAMLALWGQR